jgi:hypothetical protein
VRRGLVLVVLGLGDVVLGGVVLEAGAAEEGDLGVVVVDVEEEGDVVVEGDVVEVVDRDMIQWLSLFLIMTFFRC